MNTIRIGMEFIIIIKQHIVLDNFILRRGAICKLGNHILKLVIPLLYLSVLLFTAGNQK